MFPFLRCKRYILVFFFWCRPRYHRRQHRRQSRVIFRSIERAELLLNREQKKIHRIIFTNFTCSDQTNERRWQIRFTPDGGGDVPRHIVFIIIFISFNLSSVYWHCGIVKCAHVHYSGEYSQHTQNSIGFDIFFLFRRIFSRSTHHFISPTDKTKAVADKNNSEIESVSRTRDRQTDAQKYGHLIQRLSGVNQNTEITPCSKS